MGYLERRIDDLQKRSGRLVHELPVITDAQGQLFAQADYWQKLARLWERRANLLETELKDANELLDMVDPVTLVKRLREKLRLRTQECERLMYARKSGVVPSLELKVTGRFRSDDLVRREEFEQLLKKVNIPSKPTLGQRNHVKRLKAWTAKPFRTLRELAIEDKCTEHSYRNKLLMSRTWLLRMAGEQNENNA